MSLPDAAQGDAVVPMSAAKAASTITLLPTAREDTAYLTRASLSEPNEERLQKSLHEAAFDITAPIPKTTVSEGKLQTVLYLAYGSNMCAQTFQGQRGIRPISALNVWVPGLILTFDLPGVAYTEPCFANSRYYASERDKDVGMISEPASTITEPFISSTPRMNDPLRSNSLVGVVYEVSTEDYARIIATEGGGSAYRDIVVECHPLFGDSDVRPTIIDAESKKSIFKAHTLYSPPQTRLQRPHPDYAQPSARYLGLLQTGARENNLPADYQDYLQNLQPYTVTSKRQRIGQWIFQHSWGIWIGTIIRQSAFLADDRGKLPFWLQIIMQASFKAAWLTYDWFFLWAFGDGERTQRR